MRKQKQIQSLHQIIMKKNDDIKQLGEAVEALQRQLKKVSIENDKLKSDIKEHMERERLLLYLADKAIYDPDPHIIRKANQVVRVMKFEERFKNVIGGRHE